MFYVYLHLNGSLSCYVTIRTTLPLCSQTNIQGDKPNGNNIKRKCRFYGKMPHTEEFLLKAKSMERAEILIGI